VAERALRIAIQDFRVHEGLRTRERRHCPLYGPSDEFRIARVQRSDGWIETTRSNMSNASAFAVAGAEEQEGGEPPALAGADVVVCLMG
jgi:hypothetical protein